MSSFKEGYDTFVKVNGAKLSTDQGAQYVSTIEAEIEKFTKIINETHHGQKIDQTDIDTLKGFVAEWWHEGSYNIKEAVKGGSNRARVPDVGESGNNGLVDIFLSTGEEYQAKYYGDGTASAAQQAKTNLEKAHDSFSKHRYNYRKTHDGQNPSETFEEYVDRKNIDLDNPHDRYYSGQGGLIPADQLKDAEDWLKRRIAEETGKRPEQVKRYQEALDKLTDKIKSCDGAESIPLTEAESRELAKLAKEGGVDPADWGLTTEKLVTLDDIMREAFHAGLSAAMLSVILKVAPEVCGIICKLIKNGEVKAEDFKRLGFAALQGGGEGFIRGTIAAAVTTACKAGIWGASLKTINPSVIGIVVTLTLNTVWNACLMSLGKMNKREFAEHCAQDLIITAFAIGGGAAGTAIATSLFTAAAATFGFVIGSLIGSVVGSFVYKGLYSCVISFCVESGSTFFGLVDQNYKLPDEVLKEIGIEVFEYERFELDEFKYDAFEYDCFEFDKFEYDRIGITFLRRGVIGVNKIGYM